MQRALEQEIMDREGHPEELVERVHRDLDRVHWMLGYSAAIIQALRSDPRPVKRVLDVGCGYGGMLLEVREKLHVEVIGVDLRPPQSPRPFPILQADAARDPLPEADVAISALVAHHLSPDEISAMIRNVGRRCRRFIILDLVRSRLPLLLFSVFVAPFLIPINRADGKLSIRRAYMPGELKEIVARSLPPGAAFTQSVTPFRSRQTIDISFAGAPARD